MACVCTGGVEAHPYDAITDSPVFQTLKHSCGGSFARPSLQLWNTQEFLHTFTGDNNGKPVGPRSVVLRDDFAAFGEFRLATPTQLDNLTGRVRRRFRFMTYRRY